MLTLIQMELKQRMRRPLTWFIVLILCMMSILSISEKNEARLNRRFQGHDIYSWSSTNLIDWAELYFDEREKELYPKQYYSTYVYTKLPEEFIKANEKMI